jgi:hypothetical protein
MEEMQFYRLMPTEVSGRPRGDIGVTSRTGQHWFYQRLSSQWCCKVSVQRLHGQFMFFFKQVIVAFTRITRITSHDFWIFWWIRTGSSQLKFRGSPIPERRFSGPLRSFNSILHACARRRWAGWAGKRSHVWQIFFGVKTKGFEGKLGDWILTLNILLSQLIWSWGWYALQQSNMACWKIPSYSLMILQTRTPHGQFMDFPVSHVWWHQSVSFLM